MPECVLCLGGDVDATTKPLTGIVAANEVPRCRTPAVTKTWRKRGHWRPGHVGCTLAQELEEDKRIQAERLNDRIYRLAEVCILSLQPALSALELIGRQRGERWDFWEVFSGTGRVTAAVVVAAVTAMMMHVRKFWWQEGTGICFCDGNFGYRVINTFTFNFDKSRRSIRVHDVKA